eukprot:763889-Hanusia_phi.AAC.4
MRSRLELPSFDLVSSSSEEEEEEEEGEEEEEEVHKEILVNLENEVKVKGDEVVEEEVVVIEDEEIEVLATTHRIDVRSSPIPSFTAQRSCNAHSSLDGGGGSGRRYEAGGSDEPKKPSCPPVSKVDHEEGKLPEAPTALESAGWADKKRGRVWHKSDAPIKWANIYKTDAQRKAGRVGEPCRIALLNRCNDHEDPSRAEPSRGNSLLHALENNLESGDAKESSTSRSRSMEEGEVVVGESWMDRLKLEALGGHGKVRGRERTCLGTNATPATERKRPKPSAGTREEGRK